MATLTRLHPVSPGRWVSTTKHDGKNHNGCTFNPVVNYVRESVYSNGPHTIRIDRCLLGTFLDTIKCRFAFLEVFATEPEPSIIVRFCRIFQIAYDFRAKTEDVRHLLPVRSRSNTWSQVSNSSGFASCA